MDLLYVFFFKQKTAYEMRISDWSSDVCSSDLGGDDAIDHRIVDPGGESRDDRGDVVLHDRTIRKRVPGSLDPCGQNITRTIVRRGACVGYGENRDPDWERSEEHTSELQSLMRISYAVFCLKKKKKYNIVI